MGGEADENPFRRDDAVKSPEQARDELEFLQTKLDCCLVIDGESLQVRSAC